MPWPVRLATLTSRAILVADIGSPLGDRAGALPGEPAAALSGLVVANSPWAVDYFAAFKSVHALQVGPLRLEMSLSEWIKDGLMALFFPGSRAGDQARDHTR